jgi:hypothetical protein
MEYLIDPPLPFDTLETWQAFLREMQALPPGDEVNKYIRQAEDAIKAKASVDQPE